MQKLKLILAPILAVLFMFSSQKAFAADVVINEFSSNSDPEWVELYNNGSSLVDVTGWTISDEVQSPKMLSGSITPQGYFVYENMQGWLNNSGGDTIIVKDSSGITQNSIEYGKSGSVVGTPDFDKSAARTPDGNAAWQNNVSSTKGAANPSPTPSPTPTPTLSPTQTVSPTSSPTPTATAAPTTTKSPTPTKTSTPKPTPTPTPSLTPEVLVLGIESSPSASPSQDTGSNLPMIPIVLIILGVSVLGGSGIIYLKNHKFKKIKLDADNNENE